MPQAQAALLYTTVQNHEVVKEALVRKAQEAADLRRAHKQDSLLRVGDRHLLNWYKGAYSEEQGLRQDSNQKRDVAQGKATRRGLLVAIEAVGLALLTYLLLTK